MTSPEEITKYLNSLVREAQEALPDQKKFFPFFGPDQVSASGVRSFGQHEFQGDYGRMIRAAQDVCDNYLRGNVTTEATFRKRYANYEGLGKPASWLDKIVSGLASIGVLDAVTTPAPSPTPTTPTPTPVTPSTDAPHYIQPGEAAPPGWVGVGGGEGTWIVPPTATDPISNLVKAVAEVVAAQKK